MPRSRRQRKGIGAAGPQDFKNKKGPRGPVRGPRATMLVLGRGSRKSANLGGPAKQKTAKSLGYKNQKLKSLTTGWKTGNPGFPPTAGPGRNHNKARKGTG